MIRNVNDIATGREPGRAISMHSVRVTRSVADGISLLVSGLEAEVRRTSPAIEPRLRPLLSEVVSAALRLRALADLVESET